MYTLVFTKIEGCVRNAETVLAMFQSNLLTAVKHLFYRPVCCRTNQLIVYLQVAQHQRNLSQSVDIGRIKHCNAVDTAKHQTAIRQLTRSTVAELIASQSVGLIQ